MINGILQVFNLRLSRVFPRPSIGFIKKTFGNKELVGAEIGVYKGENSLSILKTLKIKKLYLIDPYKKYNNYDNPYDENIFDFEKIMKKAKKLLKKYPVEFIRKFSIDASVGIEKLDFVYIDGNHTYDFVKEDIQTYWNKLKKGGVLAGHDIENGEYEDNNGVVDAVMEFVYKNKLRLFIQSPDWWIVK